MKFDESGRFVKGTRVSVHYRGDDWVADLGSAHPGISDSSLKIALDMIKDGMAPQFHSLLGQLGKSINSQTGN